MNETDGTGRDCENDLDLLYWESSREHPILSSLLSTGEGGIQRTMTSEDVGKVRATSQCSPLS